MPRTQLTCPTCGGGVMYSSGVKVGTNPNSVNVVHSYCLNEFNRKQKRAKKFLAKITASGG